MHCRKHVSCGHQHVHECRSIFALNRPDTCQLQRCSALERACFYHPEHVQRNVGAWIETSAPFRGWSRFPGCRSVVLKLDTCSQRSQQEGPLPLQKECFFFQAMLLHADLPLGMTPLRGAIPQFVRMMRLWRAVARLEPSMVHFEWCSRSVPELYVSFATCARSVTARARGFVDSSEDD